MDLDKFNLVQNILLGLTLAAPIGPVNVEIIKRGMKSGFKQALLTGAGAMSADATYLTLIFFGLTAFLNQPMMKIILGVAGSVILVYLGAASIRESFSATVATNHQTQRILKNSYVTGFMLAISSPMTIVWWTGVFGALMTSQTHTQTDISAFLSCLSILLGCFLWVFFLAIALHWGKKFINERMTRSVSLVAGIFLVGFGIYFLFRTYWIIRM
ncbi:MAG: LysE family transporter [Smithellaceae bacterium]|jgi:threonine/homoserine/homoserine lactone efflux protein|nr:LysE family transporter [Smithellaceae bacterium]